MSDSAIPSSQREFRCNHCNGKIVIPKDLPPTTGPCPHCGEEITSPAPAPVSSFAAEARPYKAPPAVAAPVRVANPVRDLASTPPAVQPPAANPAPAAGPPRPVPVQTAVPSPVRKGLALKDRRSRLPSRFLVPVILVALLLVAAGSAAIFYITRTPSTIKGLTPDQEAELSRANYLRSGWEDEARTVLEAYLAANTAAEKLPFILNGSKLAGVLEDFYGGSPIDESDTPADAFTVYELSMEDRERGIFLMDYNRPPQFDFKEFFRPLAPAEVQYGIEEPGLLLTHVGRAGNFTTDPVRVRAFFKSTPEGLKLAWEIFAQTKYRTFLNFVELPGMGDRGVFRVFIVEDVPEQGRDVAGFRTYRVADPANTTDSARINVKVDSDLGKELSVINWRGIAGGKPTARTATVELAWTGGETAPFELAIQKFICWEFLGIGGQGDSASGSSR